MKENRLFPFCSSKERDRYSTWKHIIIAVTDSSKQFLDPSDKAEHVSNNDFASLCSNCKGGKHK